MNRLTNKDIFLYGILLFSMLFGAGNLIFPAYLGNVAGENVWFAVFGFILSDAGLALLGFIAVAKSGTFDNLVNRVHSRFAYVFPMIIYLCIGPGLAIPRAGSLAFEMGVKPFLPEAIGSSEMALILYTVVFFSLVFWLAKSPSKLMDRIGKVLTPTLLLLILIVFVRSLFMGLPSFDKADAPYDINPLSQGILDGYQTMDGLVAVIYGIVFITMFKNRQIESRKLQVKYLILFGLITSILLTITYLMIAYIGAAVELPGEFENGAEVLSAVLWLLFGKYGTIILGVIFTIACLSVSTGLVTSCAQFFTSKFPRIPYLGWLAIISALSGTIANLGLSQILTISVPILGLLYPITITLVVFGIIHEYLPYRGQLVYVLTICLVGLYSFVDVMNSTFLNGSISEILAFMPLHEFGFGWVIPGLIGLVISSLIEKKNGQKISANQSNAA